MKVTDANLVHTHIAAAQRKRIVLSLEYVVLILLTVACLNSSLKRDEVNSLYENNKTGRSPRLHPELPPGFKPRFRKSKSVIIQDIAIRSIQLCCIKSASIPSCHKKKKNDNKKQQNEKQNHTRFRRFHCLWWNVTKQYWQCSLFGWNKEGILFHLLLLLLWLMCSQAWKHFLPISVSRVSQNMLSDSIFFTEKCCSFTFLSSPLKDTH